MKTRKALSLFFCTVAFAAGAATVSVDTAKLAAGSWALSDASLGVQHGDSVIGATTYNVDGTPGFFAVSLKGGGTLFLAADDEMGPVLAFTAESAPDLSAGSPLRDLLEQDIKARRGVVKGEKELDGAMPNAAPKAKVSAAAGAKAGWAALTASATKASNLDRADGALPDAAQAAAAPQETLAVSDIRVEPLVKSQWSQQTAGGGNCYNYYTPNHYPCGCVATAAAQIMRYWKYPDMELPAFSNDCTVNNATIELSTVDSPNPRVYSWDSMKLIPKASATQVEREAIGRLTSDIGVALGASYGSDGTGAMSIDVSAVFRDRFAYPSGVEYWNNNWENALRDGGGLHGREARNKVIYACLDAGLPVQLAIADGNGYNGHAVVCDGYGFVTIGDVDTEFAHINMGWAGSGDMWYNIPDIDSTVGSMAGQGGVHFQIIKGATFNIATEAFGSLLTGRITDDGEPVANAVVTAYNAGTTTEAGTCTTDAHGIYAFRLPSNANYDVKVVSEDGMKSGSLEESVHLGRTYADNSYVVYSISNVGNSWGNDIDIAIPHVRIVGGNYYPNLNSALVDASTMENPIVEIFGPTLLKRPVTITTNLTIRTVPSPSADYPNPTLADCEVTVLDDAITYNGWVLQVSDGARVNISNILLRAGTALTTGLDVLEGGAAAFSGQIDLGTVVTRTDDAFILAGPFEPVGTGRLSVSCSGATARYSQFGVYECSDADAATYAPFVFNMLAPTLTGKVGEPGTLVWERVSIDPSIAVASASDDVIGVTRYLSVDLLFEDYTNGAEVVFLRDCPAEMFTNAVTVSKATTIRSDGDVPFVVTVGKNAGFNVQGGDIELVFTNIVFTRSESSSVNLVTVKDGAKLTLADGATIANLKPSGAASAVYVEKGLVTMQDGSAITNCVATRQATGKAGGVYLKDADCTFDFAGGQITDCKANPSNGGGAVYAENSAIVYVSGSATAYGNKASTSVRNIYVPGSDALVLSGGLTGGEIGVYCYGSITNGASFATVGDGVAPADVELSSVHFRNDNNAKLFAEPSDDGKTLVWVAEPPGPKPVPEAEAEVRLTVGSSSATYASISDALEVAGQNDAKLELLRDASLPGNLSVAAALVLDGNGFTLSRSGDFCISVPNADTSLVVTNIVLDGGTGEGRMLSVVGGSLSLESGTTVQNVTGSTKEMVAPIVVWDGSLVVNPGVEISGCVNNYTPEPGGALTAGAIVVNGPNASVEFLGGTITGCTGARAGGVTIANGAEARVSGDLQIKNNKLISGEDGNLVVHDNSSLVLAGFLAGRVGYTEGVGGNTNVFGTVDAGFAASTTASNLVVSARRFQHDVTDAKGMVVTNETEMLLVWSSAVGDSSVFTNVVGDVTNVYNVVIVAVDEDGDEPAPAPEPVPEVVECAPFAFAAIEAVSQGKWKLTLKPGTEHCVYTLKSSSDLKTWTTVGSPKTLSSGDISGAELEFFFEANDATGKKFWKVEGANGIK